MSDNPRPVMDAGQIGRLGTLMTAELDRRYDAGTVARSKYGEQARAIADHTDRLHADRRGSAEGDPRQQAMAVT